MPQILLEQQGDIGKVNIHSRIIFGVRLVPHQRLDRGIGHAMEGYRVGSRDERMISGDMNILVSIGVAAKQ
jgi:hypothetical protein